MRILALVALYVALASYAITDVLNRNETEIHGIHRSMWIAIIVFAPYLGALVWIGLSWRDRGRRARPAGPRPPDDDPDYLRWLRQQGRNRRDS